MVMLNELFSLYTWLHTHVFWLILIYNITIERVTLWT